MLYFRLLQLNFGYDINNNNDLHIKVEFSLKVSQAIKSRVGVGSDGVHI